MLDIIISEIANLKLMAILILAICLVMFVIMYIALNNFKWTNSKVKFFSLLYGFSTIDSICLSLILSRALYIVYLAIFNENISVEYLITLIIMSIIISALEKDYLNIITNSLISIAIYSIIYLQSSLKYFYEFVENDPLVLGMIVLLCIFTVLYSIYSFISSYNHLITLDKKDSKNYESLKNTNKIKWPKIKQNGKLKSSH